MTVMESYTIWNIMTRKRNDLGEKKAAEGSIKTFDEVLKDHNFPGRTSEGLKTFWKKWKNESLDSLMEFCKNN